MRPSPSIIAAALASCTGFGGTGLSPAFTFDARYTQSGTAPAVQTEVTCLSPSFSFSTLIECPDADGDGLSDAWELAYFGSTTAAKPHADADGDGIDNLAEYNAGLNPRSNDRFRSLATTTAFVYDARYATAADTYAAPNLAWLLSARFPLDTLLQVADSDGDGLPDWWETLYFGSTTAAKPTGDADGDGRVNRVEYNAGTDPKGADRPALQIAVSGNAFAFDARYVDTTPALNAAFAVIRLSDAFVCDTSGLYYDFDGDGLPEWWTPATDPAQRELAMARDVDGDGISDYDEWQAGTDALDKSSTFTIRLLPVSADGITTYKLEWDSRVGRTYEVWTATDLAKGWTCVAKLAGTGFPLAYSADGTAPLRFFKVSVSLCE